MAHVEVNRLQTLTSHTLRGDGHTATSTIGFQDTLYGRPTTEMVLQSDTANKFCWVKYATPISSSVAAAAFGVDLALRLALAHIYCTDAHKLVWSDGWAASGGVQVDGLPKCPLDLGRYWAMVHYGGPIEATGPKQDDSDAILATLEIVRGNSANQPGPPEDPADATGDGERRPDAPTEPPDQPEGRRGRGSELGVEEVEVEVSNRPMNGAEATGEVSDHGRTTGELHKPSVMLHEAAHIPTDMVVPVDPRWQN
ncbi:hypothetical protein OG21DRAFT_1488433 [Imleria badia]|nr:hypothetical protein OG21DRAFT_1488433 [Imleria badia]